MTSSALGLTRTDCLAVQRIRCNGRADAARQSPAGSDHLRPHAFFISRIAAGAATVRTSGARLLDQFELLPLAPDRSRAGLYCHCQHWCDGQGRRCFTGNVVRHKRIGEHCGARIILCPGVWLAALMPPFGAGSHGRCRLRVQTLRGSASNVPRRQCRGGRAGSFTNGHWWTHGRRST